MPWSHGEGSSELDHAHDDCIFCRIIAGRAPCHRVHEDELTITFLDIFPVTPGHALVVTKEHFENIFEASEESLQAVAASARRVSGAIRRCLAPEGLAVFQLNGAAAGQSVFHYHMHLLPRSAGGSMKLHTRVPGDEQELRQIAERLVAALAEVESRD
ncbi:MAG: HIT family protein [Deltaproteobacteria bacterium]|nr:HIT family protein [Deltaproteobacteria bacterium]